MAYNEGREARRNGQPKSACPYPDGNPFARMWLEGWIDSDTIPAAVSRLIKAAETLLREYPDDRRLPIWLELEAAIRAIKPA
jgi:hypothetical protein